MSCKTSVEKNKEIIKDLLRLDPVKYKNFDNVAEFILEADISAENKAISLHVISNLFVSLAEYNPAFQAGKAPQITKMNDKLDSPTAYVVDATTLIAPKKKQITSYQKLIDSIQAVADDTTSSLTTDYYTKKIIQPVRAYFTNTKFVSDKEKTDKINEVFSRLKEIQDKSPLQFYLEQELEELYNILNNVVEFKSAAEIANENPKLDTYIVVLNNKEIVEGIYNDKRVLVNTMTGEPILDKDINNKKKATYQRASEDSENGIAHTFFNNDFLTGLTIRPYSTTETYNSIADAFTSIMNPEDEVKIYAVKLGEFTDNRITETQSVPGLINKNHETFESSAQVEFLSANPKGEVLAIAREIASEDVFTMVAEITKSNGTKQNFYIYNMNNYVVLGADNTTTKLDLTNNADLKKLQELAVYRNPAGKTFNITEEQLISLKKNAVVFNMLKEKVKNRFTLVSNVTDITADFYDNYSIQKDFKIRNYESLNQAKENGSNVFHNVEVITLDEAGEIASQETTQIPFLFVRHHKTGIYSSVNFLKKDQYILHEGQKLKYNEFIRAMKFTDEVVKKIVEKDNQDFVNAVYLVKTKTGAWTYRIGKYNEHIENQVLFSKFISDMGGFLTGPEILKTFQNFYFNYFFRPIKNKRGEMSLKVDFAASRGEQLQLEIRAAQGSRFEDQITQATKKNFNFPIPNKEIFSIIESFAPTANQYTNLQKEFGFLKDLDLYDDDGKIIYANIAPFVDKIFNNTLAGKNSVVKEVLNNIETAKVAFNDLIHTHVIDVMKNQPLVYGEFLKNVKDDFGLIDNVFFNHHDLKVKTPFIKFGERTIQDVSDNLDVSFNNYGLINSATKKIAITPKKVTHSAPVSAPIQESKPVTNDVPVVTETKPAITEVTEATIQEEQQTESTNTGPIEFVNPSDDGFSDLDNQEDAPFSAEAPGTYALATKEDIETEDEWLAKTYGAEFTVETNLNAIGDIIALTKLEGSVLGAYKDRIIYLDEQLRGKGTLYHEAFHGVFRHLMTAEERRFLLDAVIKNKKNSALFTEQAIEDFSSDRNLAKSTEEIIDLIAEEVLANGFQKFMETGKAPKTILGKFFEFLQRLINMFKRNSNYIDRTYARIRAGNINSQVATSEIYNGEIAFENIPGLRKVVADKETGVVKQQQTFLESKHVNELIDSVVDQLFKIDTTRKATPFDEKFDEAALTLLNDTWNYNLLSVKIQAADTKKHELLKKKYFEKYSQYQFVLGGRKRGLNVFDLNGTNDSSFDNKKYQNPFRRNINEAAKDNKLGEVSYDMLKEAAKKKYQHMINIINYEEDMSDIEEKEIDRLKEGEDEQFPNPQNEFQDEMDEHVANVFSDKSLAEKGGIQSLPKELREALSILKYDIMDEELGITVPRYVDSYETFGILLKICSGIDDDNIVNHIKETAEMLLDDNLIKNKAYAQDLLKVHEYIKEKSQITSDEAGTVKIKNSQFYNMFIDTVKKAATDYIVIAPKFKTFDSADDQEDFDDTMPSTITSKMINFDIKDKILFEDINSTKNKILKNITSTYNSKSNTKEYKDAIALLYTYAQEIGPDDADPMFSSSFDDSVRIERMSKEMSDAFQAIGIDFPKSLIRLSLLGIDNEVNKNTPKFNEGSKFLQHYLNNEHFVLEGKYIEKDFFKDLPKLLFDLNKNAVSEEGITTINTSSELAQKLDDNEGDFKRMSIIIRNASSYIVAYDPTELPSVYRNAEGKPVYRYLPYTPILHIAEDVRKLGLANALQDEYFSNSEEYYRANPLFQDVINNNITDQARKMKLFFKNFNVSLYGGVIQSVNDGRKDGNVFKNIDDMSQYVLYLLGFLNRSTIQGRVNGEVVGITTFTRMFTTIEATNTNYLIPGLYDKYIENDGTYIQHQVNESLSVDKHVHMMMQKVRQEYERMRAEALDAKALKAQFDKDERTTHKNKKLVNKYNAVLNKDGLTANIDDPKLRAYNFSYFHEFFAANPEIEQELISSAKSQKNFENLSNGVINDLALGLKAHADKKVQEHLDMLVAKEILTKDTVGTGDTKKDHYRSSILPTKFKVDRVVHDIQTEYNKALLNYGHVVKDAFFNFWINSMFINEVFDGDIALGVKNAVDYGKRQKRNAASNSNLKKGTHKVSYGDTILAYQHPEHLEFGPYETVEDVKADPRLNIKANKATRAKLIRDFGKKVNFNGIETDTMHNLFDGQSVSLLMHHMDMYDTLGRLNPYIEYLLIRKQYAPLTATQIKHLEKNKVVLNSKKTVTASRSIYHKLSEMYIDRNDVSMFAIPINEGQYENMTKKQAFKFLHEQYSTIYNLRLENQARIKQGDFSLNKSTEGQIKTIYKEIHKFYTPLPHRTKLHDLLNSMEYHNVDQYMDTNSSKLATLLPTNINYKDADGYIQMERSSIDVPNRFKFWQVETSGIKQIIKYSVQSKVLLPANMRDIADIMEKNGEELTADEKATINSEMNDLLFDYHSTLKDVAVSHESLMKTFLTDDGDNHQKNIGFMFDLIRKNLSEQNVSTNKLKLFETDPNTGLPVHNANLGEIRDMLKFYFFSQFSKFTDEKGTGGKFIHMTSYGHNVIVSEAGETVFTEDYKKNPNYYGRVTTRPLGIHIEEKNGKKIYYIECIVPKAAQHNPKMMAKYKEKVLKMFGTRIPTEDKRSMVALRVVDFIDSANLSGIIVPQIVHILSGSDLDIDTLYTQQYSFYKNFAHQDVLYGDYTGYKDKETGEYMEYLSYMSKDKDLKTIVKRNLVSIQENSKVISDPQVLKIMELSGIDTKRYNLTSAFATYKSRHLEETNLDDIVEELDELLAALNDMTEEERDEYKYKNVNPLGPIADHMDLFKNTGAVAFKDLFDEIDMIAKMEENIESRVELGKVIDEDRINELEALKAQHIKKKGEISYIVSYMKVQALIQAISSQKLPVSIKNFQKHPFAKFVVKNKYQNANLDAKLAILSNEHVFNNLFINERSSTQMFNDILLTLGIDLAADNEKFDAFTIDGVIQSRLKNVLSKLGIGVTANINKTLAFLSQYKVENVVNLKDPIWKFRTDASADPKNYSEIGGFNTEDMRTIAIIGNILGMFADGAKDPIPAALNLNEINSPITLAMLGVGMNPSFVLAYNFIPEIRTAIENVQKSSYAVRDGLQLQKKYLSNELRNMMSAMDKKGDKRNIILNELKAAGIIGKKDSISAMEINGGRLVIKYDNKKLDQERRLNNTLTLEDIGITVSAVSNVQNIVEDAAEANQIQVEQKLSLDAQKFILLHLYREQSKQTSKLQSAGNIVNMFKSLKPDFDWLDKMKKDVKDLKEGNSIITDDVTQEMFKDDQVWSVIDRIIQYMDQKSKMFIERSDHFEHIKNSYETFFKNKDLFAKTITSFVALNKYKQTFSQNTPEYSAASPANKLLKDQETKMIKEMFTADYWFRNTLKQDLAEMQERYPDNEFLSRLKTIETGNVARVRDPKTGDLTEETYPEVIITMIGDAKFTGRLLENIESDSNNLAVSEPLFFKRLFIHDLVRTGLRTRSGSYLKFLNPDYKLGLSNHLYDFEKVLTANQAQSVGMMDGIKQMFNYTTDDEVYTFFEDMMANLIYSASYELDNNSIKKMAPSNRPLRTNINKGFQNIDTSNLNDPDAEPIDELVNYIFPLKGTANIMGDNVELEDSHYNEKLNRRIYNDNIIINLNTPGETYGIVSQANMIDIASDLNIAFESNKKKFIFPSAIQIGNSYYMLQGVDDQINKPLGQNVLFAEKFVKAKEDFITTYNTGNVASYKRLTRTADDMSLSTSALNATELQRYHDLVEEDPLQVLNGKKTPVIKISTKDLDEFVNRQSANKGSVQYNIIYPTDKDADIKDRLAELQKMHNAGEALYTLRVSDKQAPYFLGLDENKNFGNPFTGTDVAGQVPMNGITEAVQAYENWLDGQDTFKDKNGTTHDLSVIAGRREWINKQIEKYAEQDKITKLGYWKEGYKSHADILNERINLGKRSREVNTKAVSITPRNYTRANVANNPNIAYVFTENTHSITAFPDRQGGGSAIIRGLDNAYAIVTKKKYDYDTRENVDYTDTDENFEEFTSINRQLIQKIKDAKKFGIVFPQGFATDKAVMPKRFAEWLQKELLSNFGLITRLNTTETGLISIGTNKEIEWKEPTTAREASLLLIKAGAKPVKQSGLNVNNQYYFLANEFLGIKPNPRGVDLFLYPEGKDGIEIYIASKDTGAPSYITPEYTVSTIEDEIEILEAQVAELEELNDLHKKTDPAHIIADKLEAITPESAEHETGGKVGKGKDKDIDTSLISKTGLTVDDAAHNIWQNNFVDSETIKTDIIKDIIIDILKAGYKGAYLRSIEPVPLANAKYELAMKKQELKVQKMEEGAAKEQIAEAKAQKKTPKAKVVFTEPKVEVVSPPAKAENTTPVEFQEGDITEDDVDDDVAFNPTSFNFGALPEEEDTGDCEG